MFCNKRLAKQPGKNVLVVTNANAQQESFCIGPDGCVWSFELASTWRKAGKLTSTGLRATSFTVGAEGNGRLVVLAVDGLAIRTTVESGASSSSSGNRWSTPKLAAMPMGDGVLCLDKVFTKTEDGNLFVGATVFYTDTNGQMTRQFWHGVWAGNELICSHHPMHHRYVHEFWFETFCANGHWEHLIA